MEDIISFLKEIDRLAKQQEEISNAKGESFNVFKLCGVNHYENSHSDIIAEFLNPKGSHGCGNDFLLEFCRIVGLDASQYENADVDVTREHQILGGSGRVDIIIEAGTSKIIIENKIYANEGEYQLRKYRNWLNTKSGEEAPLFFLTLDGRESNDKDMKGLYTPISYESHIMPWLNECIRIAAEKPFVRESLIQYKNLVEDLTNGDVKEIERIKTLFAPISENFGTAILIKENVDKAKAMWLWNNILVPLTRKGFTVDRSFDKMLDGNDIFLTYGEEKKDKIIYAFNSYGFNNPRREIVHPDGRKESTTRDVPHNWSDEFFEEITPKNSDEVAKKAKQKIIEDAQQFQIEGAVPGKAMELGTPDKLFESIAKDFKSAIIVKNYVDKVKAMWLWDNILVPLTGKEFTVDRSLQEMVVTNDVFLSFDKKVINRKIVYAFNNLGFKKPRREIITYDDAGNEGEKKSTTSNVPHKWNNEFFEGITQNNSRIIAEKAIREIIDDKDKYLAEE